jgi:hypothetical protein
MLQHLAEGHTPAGRPVPIASNGGIERHSLAGQVVTRSFPLAPPASMAACACTIRA